MVIIFCLNKITVIIDGKSYCLWQQYGFMFGSHFIQKTRSPFSACGNWQRWAPLNRLGPSFSAVTNWFSVAPGRHISYHWCHKGLSLSTIMIVREKRSVDYIAAADRHILWLFQEGLLFLKIMGSDGTVLIVSTIYHVVWFPFKGALWDVHVAYQPFIS